ncbi:hypothetical protein DRO49_05820 [Candidatus Bathyarchaeota archaeon]|nr:MAG: hypothetical protein DRO49_05820 [Candidatus Bathyarchaeota archaeon]
MWFRDLCYSHFSGIGRPLSGLFRGLGADLEAAGMRIHPEVYMSMVGFASLISISAIGGLLVAPWLLYLITGVMPLPLRLLIYAPWNLRLIILASLSSTPLLIILIGAAIPKLAASNRTSKLRNEIPYASMYMSVMTSGGLSPYQSLMRMREIDLLPTLRDEMGRLQTLILSTGIDPVSAMERAVKVVGIKEYKSLLLGYASIVRRGGDVLHYLYSQTESMFEDLSIRIKAMGDRLSMLMEANIIVSILGALGLIMIFIVSLSLPSVGMSFTPEQFNLFSFLILPMISIIFMYLGDLVQIGGGGSTWKAYLYPAAAAPIALFIASQTVLHHLIGLRPIMPQLSSLIDRGNILLRLGEGSEAALGLSLTLLIVAIPGIIGDWLYAERDRKVFEGVTAFIRDIVETRKTGLSPERCIIALSDKDYGEFTPHLRRIALKLRWGMSLRSIFEEFRGRVRNWLSQVVIYFLIDAIEIGGGTEETLEILADFVEKTGHLEKERRGLLAPLTFIPYIGAILLTSTTVIFLRFFANLTSLGGIGIPQVTLRKVLLTPLVLHSFILGLTTGKLGCSNRVSAGFKHSAILVIVSLLGIWAASNILSLNLMG